MCRMPGANSVDHGSGGAEQHMERVTGIEPACPAWEVQNRQLADLAKVENT